MTDLSVWSFIPETKSHLVPGRYEELALEALNQARDAGRGSYTRRDMLQVAQTFALLATAAKHS